MLTRYEREVHISFNEEEDMATIYTASPTWIKKMDKLAQKDKAITIKNRDNYGVTYNCPKKYIKVHLPPVYSDEMKQKCAERLRAYRQNKNGKQEEAAKGDLQVGV